MVSWLVMTDKPKKVFSDIKLHENPFCGSLFVLCANGLKMADREIKTAIQQRKHETHGQTGKFNGGKKNQSQ
jgi:hypothetical protein